MTGRSWNGYLVACRRRRASWCLGTRGAVTLRRRSRAGTASSGAEMAKSSAAGVCLEALVAEPAIAASYNRAVGTGRRRRVGCRGGRLVQLALGPDVLHAVVERD